MKTATTKNEESVPQFVMIDKGLLENIIMTLRRINVRDEDFDSMDRLVGCVGALTRVLRTPPVENMRVKPENAPENLTDDTEPK